MEFIEWALIGGGCWLYFWTVVAIVSPTKHKKYRSGMWDWLGGVADRFGLQIKDPKD